VCCSLYDIPTINLQHNISNVPVLLLCDFFIVQPSASYRNTAQNMHALDYFRLLLNDEVLVFQMLSSLSAFLFWRNYFYTIPPSCKMCKKHILHEHCHTLLSWTNSSV